MLGDFDRAKFAREAAKLTDEEIFYQRYARGANRMIVAFENFCGSSADAYKTRLFEIAQNYIKDDDADFAYTVDIGVEEDAKIKILLGPAVKAQLKVSKTLSNALKDYQGAKASNSLEKLLKASRLLEDKLRKETQKFGFIETSSKRKSTKNLCIALAKLRSCATNRPFAKYLTPRFDELGRESGHFKGSDAEFVLRLANAMDPNIHFAQVRSAFTRISQRQGKNDTGS